MKKIKAAQVEAPMKEPIKKGAAVAKQMNWHPNKKPKEFTTDRGTFGIK